MHLEQGDLRAGIWYLTRQDLWEVVKSDVPDGLLDLVNLECQSPRPGNLRIRSLVPLLPTLSGHL